MTRTDHLLAILIEEAAEVQQRATKALRFGLKETQPGQSLDNTERLVGELNDLLAAIDLLQREGILPCTVGDSAALIRKQERIEKYFARSREMGRLDEGDAS